MSPPEMLVGNQSEGEGFTPGPWFLAEELEPNGNCLSRAIMARDTFIALAMLDDEDDAEAEANATLIAAAPDLLEALQNLFAHPGTHHEACIHWTQVGCDCEFSEVANQARAALSKAVRS